MNFLGSTIMLFEGAIGEEDYIGFHPYDSTYYRIEIDSMYLWP